MFNADFCLVEYLLDKGLKESIKEISTQLIQNLIVLLRYDRIIVTRTQFDKNEQLRQYLRKFSFFYRYYYIKKYPNDLSKLSNKKTNMLAIKSLFLLQSL